MKKILILCLGGILAFCSCAKVAVTGKNDLNKKYFDAWIKTHHPEAKATPLGVHIIEDIPGTGDLVGDEKKSPYLYVSYYSTDLEGTYTGYTGARIAQQLGKYDETEYYGPYIWDRTYNGLYAGLEDMISTMRVGGTRTAVIPGWLVTFDRYGSSEGYLENVSGTDAIYTVTVEEIIPDIVKWEADSLESYVKRNYPDLDSTSYGYYYKQLDAPTDTAEFNSGTEVRINYTGRLLNGQVFDTTIKDTAKMHKIYVEGRSYTSTYVTWAEDNEDIKLGSSSSSVIKGFEKCIRGMKKGERGLCLFVSSMGYESSGNGSTIPGYSPLIFEIECLGSDSGKDKDD